MTCLNHEEAYLIMSMLLSVVVCGFSVAFRVSPFGGRSQKGPGMDTGEDAKSTGAVQEMGGC